MNSLFESITRYLSTHGTDLLLLAALFFGVLLVGLVAHRIVFGRLRLWASKSHSKLEALLVEALHGPVFLWIIILAIWLATDLSRLPPEATRWSGRALMALWIVSLTLMLARLAGRMVQVYAQHSASAAPAGSLAQTLATMIVALLGGLTLLNEFGISITPYLAALGVGGIAVALALQDTLSNFFSGFYVSLARHIRVGDFIQLESSQKGYVTDIGWRATTLRERQGNLIVIPNNKLAQSIVTNYHLPTPRMMLLIPVSVSYASDPEHVEKILLDVMHQATGELPGLLAEPSPVAFLIPPGFGPYALEFTVICHVADYEAQFPVQHNLRKRIFHRLRQEGIVIPFPTQSLEYHERPPVPPPPQ